MSKRNESEVASSGAVHSTSETKIYTNLKGFTIGQLNITSLIKHIEELRIFINKTSFDLVCIN